jgi:hypothetical protein
MKHTWNLYAWKSILVIAILMILNNAAMAQLPTDSTKPKTDTTTKAMVDTTATTTTVAPSDTAKPVQTAPASTNKSKKKRQLIIYAGANSNQLGGSTDTYDANSGVGYHMGLAWQKSGFIYGQFGLRYNNAVYGFNSKATSADTGDLKVQALDIPLTVGINFLSFTKVASLRGFISAMPSFTLGVSDNHFGVSKDDVKSFILYGQIGIGATFAFGLVDIGYNYGFEGLMENFDNTKPSQWFISLGVRF